MVLWTLPAVGHQSGGQAHLFCWEKIEKESTFLQNEGKNTTIREKQRWDKGKLTTSQSKGSTGGDVETGMPKRTGNASAAPDIDPQSTPHPRPAALGSQMRTGTRGESLFQRMVTPHTCGLEPASYFPGAF